MQRGCLIQPLMYLLYPEVFGNLTIMKTIFKKITALIMVLCLAAGLFGCAPSGKKDERQKYSGSLWDYFDTVITIIAYCDSEEEFGELKSTADTLFDRYNKLFDIYNSYEGIVNIKTINDSAGKAPVKVDEDIIDLIEMSKKLYEDTDGNVNVAFGSVLRLWHDAREKAESDPSAAYVPDIEDLRTAAQHCDINKVIVDEAAKTVYLEDPEMSLDVGATAKGFATEKVAAELAGRGFECFLITAGSSSIKACGKKPGDQSWTSAVETDPEGDLLEISDYSITTSGIYQRYYECGGKIYHHIINKDTLMPENNFLSVTIITGDSGIGDGMSTAVFNMSLEDGLKFVNSKEGLYAMWVSPEGEKTYSEGFEDFIKK